MVADLNIRGQAAPVLTNAIAAFPLGSITLEAAKASPQDLTQAFLQYRLPPLQSVLIDATAMQAPVLINVLQTQQTQTFKAGAVSCLPFIIPPTSPKFQLASQTAGAINVILFSQVLIIPPFDTQADRPSMGSPGTVAATTSSVVLFPSNRARKGGSVFNDSGATLYLMLAASAASPTAYTVKVLPQGYFEIPYGYYGEIRGAWDAAIGNAFLTEYL